MKEKGIIDNYAIGGATALIYYFEPINTQDIDVFILLKEKDSSKLINLNPIYQYLRRLKYKVEKEYVIIQQIPVQFLVPYNDLLSEAVENAIYVNYSSDKVRIIALEYLMAIMVQTGRTKDKARLEDIIKCDIKYNKYKFHSILKKHSLFDKWKKFKHELLK
jgi:tetrahydromethanopterin S-methyltransferase subunit A